MDGTKDFGLAAGHRAPLSAFWAGGGFWALACFRPLCDDPRRLGPDRPGSRLFGPGWRLPPPRKRVTAGANLAWYEQPIGCRPSAPTNLARTVTVRFRFPRSTWPLRTRILAPRVRYALTESARTIHSTQLPRKCFLRPLLNDMNS